MCAIGNTACWCWQHSRDWIHCFLLWTATDEHCLHGVGFAVCKSLISCINLPTSSPEHLMKLELNTDNGSIAIFSVYAPTLTALDGDKDAFYDELWSTVLKSSPTQCMSILHNFNTRISADHASWPCQTGHNGVMNRNENHQWVLKLCIDFEFCIANTYFHGGKWKTVLWPHPHSGYWHQLDLVLAHCKQIQSILHIATHHSANCITEHTLVHL